MSFGQRATHGPSLQIVNQSIYFFEYVQQPLQQTLVFHEVVNGFIGPYLHQQLIFNEVIKEKTVRHKLVTDTLNFINSAAGAIYDTCKAASNIPPISRQKNIILTYGTIGLTLRNPSLGNSDKLQQTRISRQTRGGDLMLFRDPLWPKSETFSYKVQLLKQQDVYNLLNFLDITLGLSIKLLDWQGAIWDVLITNPATAIAQKGRFVWEAQLEFEVIASQGRIVEGGNSNNAGNLNFSQVINVVKV